MAKPHQNLAALHLWLNQVKADQTSLGQEGHLQFRSASVSPLSPASLSLSPPVFMGELPWVWNVIQNTKHLTWVEFG